LVLRKKFRLDEFIREGLAARHDPREVVADRQARYYGIVVQERTLVPEDDAKLGKIRFEDWLTETAAQSPSAHPQPTGVAGEKESRKKAG
jgi:hypothetical protein